MKEKPTGIYVIATFLILGALGSIYHGLKGYPIYFLVSLIYALLGYGLIKLSPLARIGTLVVLPIIVLISLGTALGILLAKSDPTMLAELVEMGIKPETLNTKLALSLTRILAVVATFVYLLKQRTRQHFGKANPVGCGNAS